MNSLIITAKVETLTDNGHSHKINLRGGLLADHHECNQHLTLNFVKFSAPQIIESKLVAQIEVENAEAKGFFQPGKIYFLTFTEASPKNTTQSQKL